MRQWWLPRICSRIHYIHHQFDILCVFPIIISENYDLSKLRDKLEEERLKIKLAAAKKNKTIETLTFWENRNNQAANDEIESLEDQIDSVKSKCNCFPICSDLTYVGTATSLDIELQQEMQRRGKIIIP